MKRVKNIVLITAVSLTVFAVVGGLAYGSFKLLQRKTYLSEMKGNGASLSTAEKATLLNTIAIRTTLRMLATRRAECFERPS